MIDALSALLGEKKVKNDPLTLQQHASDKWYASALPEAVVFAEHTSDVSKTLQYASKHKLPVTTRGGGVGYVGACVPVHGGIALSLARMNQILEINPEDAVAVVQPGVITGKLANAAAQKGWYYPPDPASLHECTIGGNIATNAGGPRCLKYGVTRHYVLGLQAVLPNGDILRTGSRCHKNKTGFDLSGLMVGSEGMLSVITEATLRLIPHPQQRAMLTCTFLEFPQAATAVQKVFAAKHFPSALEISDGFTLKAARNYLGNEALPDGDAHLIIELDGRASSLKTELHELKALLKKNHGIGIELHTSTQACEDIWQLRREFSYSLRHTGLHKLNEDIVIPRSKLVHLVQFAQQLQKNHQVPIACFGHAGDGNIHVNLMVQDYEQAIVQKKMQKVLDLLFTWVLENNGVITGEHGVGLAKKPWFHQAIGETSFKLHQGIKHALDPNHTLNPGKFL